MNDYWKRHGRGHYRFTTSWWGEGGQKNQIGNYNEVLKENLLL